MASRPQTSDPGFAPPPAWLEQFRAYLTRFNQDKIIARILADHPRGVWPLVATRMWQWKQTPHLLGMSKAYVKDRKKRLRKQMEGVSGAISTFEQEGHFALAAALRGAAIHLHEIHERLVPLPAKKLGAGNYAHLARLPEELATWLPFKIPLSVLVKLVRAADAASGHKGIEISEKAVRHGLKRVNRRKV